MVKKSAITVCNTDRGKASVSQGRFVVSCCYWHSVALRLNWEYSKFLLHCVPRLIQTLVIKVMAEGVICYRVGFCFFLSPLFKTWRKFYNDIYLQNWKAFSVKQGVLLLFEVWKLKRRLEGGLRFQKRGLEFQNMNVHTLRCFQML